METITLFGSDRPWPVLDVPANEGEFLTNDGRYFVDVEAFMETLYNTLHDQCEPVFDSRPDFTPTDGAHVLVNMTNSAIDMILMELKFHLALSE